MISIQKIRPSRSLPETIKVQIFQEKSQILRAHRFRKWHQNQPKEN